MKSEILSDFNEFESINREAESIIGKKYFNSDRADYFVKRVKTMSESVLKMKITPDRIKEAKAQSRRGSMLIDQTSGASLTLEKRRKSVLLNEACSPLEAYIKSGRLQRSRAYSDAQMTVPSERRTKQFAQLE